MRKSHNNKIDAYTDAAVRVAQIRVHARIAGVSPEDYLDSRHDDSLEIIERLARYYWRRDMANELNMTSRLAIAFEKHRRSITDPEQLIKNLEKQVGSCGQYYEIWLPRMMGAIEGCIRFYDLDEPLRAALWAAVDYPATGPTEKDWEEVSDMESDAWDAIREASI
ncbi:hypothetical protein HF670_11265 [Acidithiobacillus thiooxidans]|uniref:hypothetical protein n=1 Tax=Acidithiobacillus thiooxidans TaxID=930 RepID=UPI001C079392|nr:hypothetical protein [Acidithiobacillus thiooxidans]MBU2840128.1 hypothetical protein [Acidithiobacillus thiooxidans]